MKSRWIAAGLFSATLCLIHHAVGAPHNQSPVPHNSNSRQAENMTHGSPVTSTNVVTPNPGQGYAEVASQAPVPDTSRERELSGVEPEPSQSQAKPVVQNVLSDKESLMQAAGIPESDWGAVDYIVSHESSWRVQATNPDSGAYGLCQSYPAEKMASAGADWKDNPVTQLKWCSQYATSRYGGWWNSYAAWKSKSWW